MLDAGFIEVVVAHSANHAGLETTIRRSPTIGTNEVSFVVFAHRRTR